jgi:hypothetical protein
MGTDDPYIPHIFKRFGPVIKAMSIGLQSDAYWIIKLAFHPELKSLFIKNHGTRR